MRKKKAPTQRAKWARNFCVWCGEEFPCCQARTATCSNKCRLRLHRYRAETGFDPIHPPGDITTRTAVDLLIMELLMRERARRASLDRS